MPDQTPRLFVAIWPPAEFATRLLSLPRPELPGIRWSEPDRWHLTLRFLGPADAMVVRKRLDRVPLPSVDVVLGPSVEVLGDRVVVVPAAGADELATAVGRATVGIGGKPDDRPFRGHVTIGRIRGDGVQTGQLEPILGFPVSACFRATEIDLVESLAGPRGPTYRVIETWALEVPGEESDFMEPSDAG